LVASKRQKKGVNPKCNFKGCTEKAESQKKRTSEKERKKNAGVSTRKMSGVKGK